MELLVETQMLLEEAESRGLDTELEEEFRLELDAFRDADEGSVPVERVETLNAQLKSLLEDA